MTHPTTNNGGGCFSGIARLLLCRGSLQTHPSDEIIAKPIPTVDQILNKTPASMANLKVEAPVNSNSTTPGVVARLMGLDSLPDSIWAPKCGGKPDFVTRSRSVNFMDYFVNSDLDQLEQISQQKQHRRVRTSVSFREVPIINENQQDLFVFSLDKSKKNGYRAKKPEVGFENVRQRKEIEKLNNRNGNAKMRIEHVKHKQGVAVKKELKNEGKINLKDVQRRKQLVSNGSIGRQTSRIGSCKGGGQVSPGFVSPRKKDGIPVKKVKIPVKIINQKEVLVESKFMKKIKNQHAKSACSSEDSSPVSVLDADEFLVHHQMPFPEKKSVRKSTNIKNKGSKSRGVEQKRVAIKNGEIEEVKKLSRLTEKDMKESKWVKEFEIIEEICLYFGEQIMDLLVEELVQQ